MEQIDKVIMSNHHACLQGFFRLFQKNMISKVKIDIVYFVQPHHHSNTLLKDIKHQWSEILKTGIMNMSTTLHLVFSPPYDQDFPIHDIKKLLPKHGIVLHFTQTGLPFYILYQLAERDRRSSHYILYFDGKNGGGGKLVSEWKKVLSKFRKNPSINKIGLNPETKCWWVRASYLSETPNDYAI